MSANRERGLKLRKAMAVAAALAVFVSSFVASQSTHGVRDFITVLVIALAGIAVVGGLVHLATRNRP